MLHAAVNSLLSLVMMATLLWGGCISCEQFFMFPGADTHCCNESGQCERPANGAPKAPKKECNRMPLAIGGGAHLDIELAPAPTVMMAVAVPPSMACMREDLPEIPPEPSPPDLQVLNSTFLI